MPDTTLITLLMPRHGLQTWKLQVPGSAGWHHLVMLCTTHASSLCYFCIWYNTTSPNYHSVVRGSQGGVLFWGPKMGLKDGPGTTLVFNWWLFPWASLSLSLFSQIAQHLKPCNAQPTGLCIFGFCPLTAQLTDSAFVKLHPGPYRLKQVP